MTNVNIPGAGNIDIDVRPDRHLANLQFALMGTFEARKGPWSFIGDVSTSPSTKGSRVPLGWSMLTFRKPSWYFRR